MKITRTILAVLLSVMTVFGTAACVNEGKHKHVFGEWEHSAEATDCETSTLQRTCTECTYVETRKGTASDHVWTAEYGYNETEHWFTCVYCEAGKDKEAHDNNGVDICRKCEGLLPTSSVTYVRSSDGSYAIATGYDESETDIVVLASTYQGVPVKEIAEGAFMDCSSLARVRLSKSITDIGASAFSGCKSLMGIMLHDGVTKIGENAFENCGRLLIYCEAKEKPLGWHENWTGARDYYIHWGHKEAHAGLVSLQSVEIADSMLREYPESNRQIVISSDLGNMKAPEGFSKLTRFNSVITGTSPWLSEVLWYRHYNTMNIAKYGEVWFAAKLENAYWAFVSGKPGIGSEWVYVHMKQTGKDEDNYIRWDIDVSVGDQVYEIMENQTGKAIDAERPVNSIARMLWDEGFLSPDKHALLIYPDKNVSMNGISIYCTEVRGITRGANA